jgi:hypothetical protein
MFSSLLLVFSGFSPLVFPEEKRRKEVVCSVFLGEKREENPLLQEKQENLLQIAYHWHFYAHVTGIH